MKIEEYKWSFWDTFEYYFMFFPKHDKMSQKYRIRATLDACENQQYGGNNFHNGKYILTRLHSYKQKVIQFGPWKNWKEPSLGDHCDVRLNAGLADRHGCTGNRSRI